MNRSEERQKFLLETAVRLDRKLTGKIRRLPLFIEDIFQLLFNLFGFLLGFAFLKIPPAKISNQVTAWIARYQAKNKLASFLSIEDSSELKQIQVELKPAKLILISHPETAGRNSYLLGNLIYYAVKVNNHFLNSSKFKFVQAIDPFALDTLSPFLEATYAGFMAAGHIAVDRQPYQRTFLQKLLFFKHHYTQTIFHILRELKAGSTVCLALAGGVIHNSRILYVIREFAKRVFRTVIPAETVPENSPLTKGRQTESEQVLGVAGIQKNFLEKKLISLLTKDTNSCVVTGKLSQKEKEELFQLLFSSLYPPFEKKGRVELTEMVQNLIRDLEEELSLSVPYRFRLFHILFKRLVARKKPILIFPLVHTRDEQIVVKMPVFISSYEEGKVKWRDWKTAEEKMQNEGEFVRVFVSSSFHPGC